jgi:hypothetical protein
VILFKFGYIGPNYCSWNAGFINSTMAATETTKLHVAEGKVKISEVTRAFIFSFFCKVSCLGSQINPVLDGLLSI